MSKDITSFYKGKGCPKCLNSGYRGRLGIYELLICDDEIRSLILSRPSTEVIKRQARKNGMITLQESGIDKVKLGITTAEEVLQNTQEAEGN